MTLKRGDILRILPQLGDTVCLGTDANRILVAVPTYEASGISGYITASIGLGAFTIGKRNESVSPNGSDDEVFKRAVEAKYLNPQIHFD